MSAPWQRIHVQLLEEGNLQVRTHRRPPDPEPSAFLGSHERSTAAAQVRRQQIRKLLADDLSRKEIAQRLGVCVRTVQLHITAIKEEG